MDKKHRHTKNRKEIKLSPEDHAKYLKESQRLHKEDVTMGEMAGYFIDLHLEYDFYNPEWKSKITEAMAQVDANKYSFLSDCPAVAVGKDSKGKFVYQCVWQTKRNSPPLRKILGDTEELANAVCRACNKTASINEGVDDYVRQIEKLKEQVQHGGVVKVPSCIHGGRLSDDGKKLYCKDPKMSAQNQVVDTWCKTLRDGANCKSLRWTTIHMKGKLLDSEK